MPLLKQQQGSSLSHLSGKLVFDPSISEISKQGIPIVAYSDQNEDGKIGPEDIPVSRSETDASGRFSLHLDRRRTFVSHIREEKDDAWQASHSNKSFVVSKYLPTEDRQGEGYFSGLRFRHIEIPNDASILSASIQLIGTEDQTFDQPFYLYTEQSPSPAPFSSETENLSRRRPGKTRIDWQLAKTVEGQKYQSPDISTLIQSVIQQPDWQQGQAIVLLIEGDQWLRHERNGQGNGPRLSIQYVVPEHPLLISIDSVSTTHPIRAIPQEISWAEQGEILLPILGKTPSRISPVRWKYIHGTNKGGSVFLQWDIYRMEEDLTFDIMRSTNGMKYERIGSIPNSNPSARSDQGFQFTDPSPPPSESSVLAYRVRVSHQSEPWAYSKVLTVSSELSPSPLFLQIGSSDSDTEVHLLYRSDYPGESRLEILNITGQMIESMKVEPTSDLRTLRIPIENWPKGRYYFQLQHGDNTVMRPFVVK